MLQPEDIPTVLKAIVAAEKKSLPGPAKKAWVTAEMCNYYSASPPPDWVLLLFCVLDKLIDVLLDYLKHKYGDDWPERLASALRRKVMPWEDGEPWPPKLNEAAKVPPLPPSV
jgi:hypothetical protein